MYSVVNWFYLLDIQIIFLISWYMIFRHPASFYFPVLGSIFLSFKTNQNVNKFCVSWQLQLSVNLKYEGVPKRR